jgi:hypothetical protein
LLKRQLSRKRIRDHCAFVNTPLTATTQKVA